MPLSDLLVGKSDKVKWAAIITGAVGLVLGAIIMILSFAGVFSCVVGCVNVNSNKLFPFQTSAADFWPLTLGAFALEAIFYTLVMVLVYKMGKPQKTIQLLNFVVVPIIIVLALLIDGIIISINSYMLGYQTTLFCSLDGCQVQCMFNCVNCTNTLGTCTYIEMRVIIFFFTVARIITAALNILYWRDAQTGALTARFQ